MNPATGRSLPVIDPAPTETSPALPDTSDARSHHHLQRAASQAKPSGPPTGGRSIALPVLPAGGRIDADEKWNETDFPQPGLAESGSRGQSSVLAAAGKGLSKTAYALRVAARALALPASIWRARSGRPQMPRVLTHTITFGCNAKCVMCDSWQLPTAGDLNLDDIEKIYRQLPPMDAVRLTGGEPFVRKDMPQIYQLALTHLKPMLMHISSNGFLVDRIINFCETRDRRVPLELAISIDGVGQYHNDIRVNSNAWKTAWRTLSTLASRRKELNLSLAVNQTIVDSAGLAQYELLHRELEPLRVEHHIVIAYAESATYSLTRDRRIDFSGDTYQSFSELDEKQLTDVLTQAEAHAAALPWHRRLARRYYLRGIRERTLKQKPSNNPTCQALHTHLRLFPNGNVPVCQFNSNAVGNLREQSFQQVWNSATTATERQWVRACTGCWAECEVAPSSIYTLDLFKS